MERCARLMIIGSNRLLRECLAATLIKRPEIEAVGHCRHPEETKREIADHDALLLDFSLPQDGTLQLVRELSRPPSSVKILLFGVDSATESEVLRYIEAGAKATLAIDASLEDMCQVIGRVLGGEVVYPPKIASSMFHRLAELASEQRRSRRLEAMILTPRELQVLQLLAAGLRNTTIASQLQISVHTVKNHVHNILDKLQVGDRMEAVALAFQREWLDDSGSQVLS